jgi:hypothetical protein
MTERLWTREAVADFLDVTPRYVDMLRRQRPDFPPPLMIAYRLPRWNPASVRDWALRQECGNSAETRAAA